MKSRFAPSSLVLALVSAAALCSCLGNSGSSSAAPAGVQTFAGEGAISLTWQDDSSVNYWVFHAQDPSLSTDNWTNLLNAGVLVNTASPSILCGQLNNPATPSYFPAIYFTVNGRTGSAAGGPGSAPVSSTPRPAGGPYSAWEPGQSIPSPLSAIAYAAVTPCGYSGRPPSGVFVAVGPGGTIYTSTLAANVAGPLTPSIGNPVLSWVRANTPAGFSQDLTGVASYSYGNPSTPGVASFVFIAVGKGGTVLRSTDGMNWQQLSGIPSGANLAGVAAAGSTFIAVGDSGVVLTSTDSLNWSLNTAAATASANALSAIRCVGASCVAVGANGATLWTTNAGGSWTLFNYTGNNWTGIAYGNNNANADAIVSEVNGALSLQYANLAINTWVVYDANGNYAAANTLGGWFGSGAIAPSIVAMEYTTRFMAIDAVGNTYASENGVAWQSVGPSNVLDAVAMANNGMGYVAIGRTGSNASAF